MDSARGKALVFCSVGARSSLSHGGCSVAKQVVTLSDHRGQSVGWAIRKVVHPTVLNRLVDNPQVDKSTIHQIFGFHKIFHKNNQKVPSDFHENGK